MKISKLASLVVVGALVTPLAYAADNKPEGTTKTWVKDSMVTTKIKAQLAASKVSSPSSP
jgi:hyperosmotically inducible protein